MIFDSIKIQKIRGFVFFLCAFFFLDCFVFIYFFSHQKIKHGKESSSMPQQLADWGTSRKTHFSVPGTELTSHIHTDMVEQI